jgi:ribonuclease HI
MRQSLKGGNYLINYTDIFNYESLNIFTDASIYKKPDDTYFGCAGYVAVCGDQVYEIDEQIYDNTTSNNSEIKAVRMGIETAIKWKEQFSHIRLFSDSQLCIFGLRDRFTNWVENSSNGTINGSNGQPIINQEIFIDIANLILVNNLHIELYHQDGHVALTNPRSIGKARQDFIRFNNLNTDIDQALTYALSYYNNMVDQSTRRILQDFVDHYANYPDYGYSVRSEACKFIMPNDFDIKGYYSLTHDNNKQWRKIK